MQIRKEASGKNTVSDMVFSHDVNNHTIMYNAPVRSKAEDCIGVLSAEVN